MAVIDGDLVLLTRNHDGGTASAPGQSQEIQDLRLLRTLALDVGHQEANEGAWEGLPSTEEPRQQAGPGWAEKRPCRAPGNV